MRNALILSAVVLIALLANGCCKQIDRAKEIAFTVKDATEAGARLAEDFEKLKDKDGNFELTSARLDRFFVEYPIFRNLIEEKNKKAEELSEKYDDDLVGLDMFIKLDEDLRKAGVNNPAEFYLTMTEVSGAYFYISSTQFMQSAKGQISEAVKTMKEQLASPDLPEDQKASLREAISEMEKSPEAQVEKPDGLMDSEIELVRANYEKIGKLMGFEQENAPAEETTDQEAL